MSFLLAGKPRRRGKVPMQSSGPTCVKGLTKVPANNNASGGQIQIQRNPREQRSLEGRSISKHESLTKQKDSDHQKAIQAAGISMEQVMEDLKVLEEQQRESQLRLANMKTLKKNRIDRCSSVESHVSSIKYQNGQYRAQLGRFHEILHASNSMIEKLKLDAGRNDGRLKSIDKKLKKAFIKSQMYHSQRCKVDNRIIDINSTDSLCRKNIKHRGDQLISLERDLQEIRMKEKHCRDRLMTFQQDGKERLREISDASRNISIVTESLYALKQTHIASKLKVQTILAETETEEQKFSIEFMNLSRNLEESRLKTSNVESSCKDFDEKLSTLTKIKHDLWTSVIEIQKGEGHVLCEEPLNLSAPPHFELETILKSVIEEENRLGGLKKKKDELKETIGELEEKMSTLKVSVDVAQAECSTKNKSLTQEQKSQLEIKKEQEECLQDLVRQQGYVAELNCSVTNLQDMKKEATNVMARELGDLLQNIKRQQVDLSDLEESLAWKQAESNKTNQDLETKIAQLTTKRSQVKETLFLTQASLAEIQSKKKKDYIDEDLFFNQELERLKKEQEKVGDETRIKIDLLLKEYPNLSEISYTWDSVSDPKDRITKALQALENHCRTLKEDIALRKHRFLASIRKINTSREKSRPPAKKARAIDLEKQDVENTRNLSSRAEKLEVGHDELEIGNESHEERKPRVKYQKINRPTKRHSSQKAFQDTSDLILIQPSVAFDTGIQKINNPHDRYQASHGNAGEIYLEKDSRQDYDDEKHERKRRKRKLSTSDHSGSDIADKAMMLPSRTRNERGFDVSAASAIQCDSERESLTEKYVYDQVNLMANNMIGSETTHLEVSTSQTSQIVRRSTVHWDTRVKYDSRSNTSLKNCKERKSKSSKEKAKVACLISKESRRDKKYDPIKTKSKIFSMHRSDPFNIEQSSASPILEVKASAKTDANIQSLIATENIDESLSKRPRSNRSYSITKENKSKDWKSKDERKWYEISPSKECKTSVHERKGDRFQIGITSNRLEGKTMSSESRTMAAEYPAEKAKKMSQHVEEKLNNREQRENVSSLKESFDLELKASSVSKKNKSSREGKRLAQNSKIHSSDTRSPNGNNYIIGDKKAEENHSLVGRTVSSKASTKLKSKPKVKMDDKDNLKFGTSSKVESSSHHRRGLESSELYRDRENEEYFVKKASNKELPSGEPKLFSPPIRAQNSKAVQSSGISSGERLISKSRRRKVNSLQPLGALIGTKGVKNVEDFSFNF